VQQCLEHDTCILSCFVSLTLLLVPTHMRIRISKTTLGFASARVPLTFFCRAHSVRGGERDPKYNQKQVELSFILFCIHTLSAVAQDPSRPFLGSRSRARSIIMGNTIKNKRSFLPTIAKYSSSGAIIRRPANPSRVKKNVHKREYISITVDEKKELHHHHHGRIRGDASAAIV
jgi:hypothetical protein